MTINTDELVERVARALIDSIYPGIEEEWMDYKMLVDGVQYKSEARAAITAILPDIVQACAVKCDELAKRCKTLAGAQASTEYRDSWNDKADAYEDAAIAIRSLLENDHEQV